MKWFGQRSRAEEFAEAIRPELQGLAVPEPRAEHIERIIASRESGTRVILPDVNGAAPPMSRRFLLPAAIIAAGLLLFLPFRSSPRRSVQGSEASSLARMATEWLPGSVAFAQSDASRTSRRFAPIELSRPEKLKPMRLEYLRLWRDSTSREIGRVTGLLTVQPAVRDGTAAWLIVVRNQGTRSGHTVFAIDSTTVARENLHLLSHTATERPYSRYDVMRIDQRFRGDSIVGDMHAYGTRTSSAYRLIRRKLAAANRPYIIDPLAPVILGTVNLHAGWRGSASLVGWAVRDDDVFMPIDLRVDGAETITVPAGRFDCWRLTIDFGGRSLTYWARKSDGVGVRSIERDASGVSRETTLVKL
jgi:hypothetical protein